MFISGAVMATLYFGGYDYPGFTFMLEKFGNNVAVLLGVGALIGKALFFVFVFMWVRWTLPRFRYDQLMNLGWTGLIPLAMFNVVLTGGSMLLTVNQEGSTWITALVSLGGVIVMLIVTALYSQTQYKKKKLATA
jgi:NADH-quinone oxidoreductase subunit H